MQKAAGITSHSYQAGLETWRAETQIAAALLVVLATAAPVARVVAQPAVAGPQRWPVKQREHVDLWLHGFAMIAPDSSTVPLYRRDYRDALLVARNSASAWRRAAR